MTIDDYIPREIGNGSVVEYPAGPNDTRNRGDQMDQEGKSDGAFSMLAGPPLHFRLIWNSPGPGLQVCERPFSAIFPCQNLPVRANRADSDPVSLVLKVQ